MTRATKAVEESLKGLDNPEIERRLAKAENQTLVELLDSKSIKVGDSAAVLLMRKKSYPLLISAALEGKVTTKVGKIRTKNILFGTGRRYPEAHKVYLLFLNDQSDEIAHNSLLALVFWGDKQAIPIIQERGKQVKLPEDAREFDRACVALQNSDPTSFNPHFADDTETWK